MQFDSLTSQLRNEFDESKLPDFQHARMFGSIHHGADNIDFQVIADALDCHRDFYGAGIVYSDGLFKRYLVRPSKRRGSHVSSELTHIIIFNLEAGNAPEAELTKTVSEPSLVWEIGSTALSCGGAVAFLLTTAGSGAAIPFTGGASSAGVVLAYAGFTASSLQCMNGAYRIYNLTGKGDEGVEHIGWLDSQDWYVTTTTLLDITSLASGTAALKEAYQTYRVMKATSSRRAAEWLNKMPRHEKKRLTEEIIRYHNPGISNREIKNLIYSGQYPKRYPTEQIRQTLKNHLINTLSSGGAFAGSGMTGVIRNPASIVTSGNYIIGAIYSIAVEKPASYISNGY
ncbi:hypothetical protein M5U04_00375 [Xenorhabdus sp. XENO-1]|uniref:hypothetical protein n=1 Tax=Xenorhabdus bovienii TaxID=40576 RepID=UPI0020CA3847|nr:hypothetical protein [Xenorhabdus bovienii]MCP9266592.1 hypothetical protein [Xenorhabdus bovienii subsp. africana]